MSSTIRRSGSSRAGLTTLVAILLLAGLAVALRSNASAQGPATRTVVLKELDKGSTFTHIRNTKTKSQQANVQGDVIAFTNPLADAASTRVGKLHAACTTTTGARNFMKSTITCAGVYALRDGTITVQVITSPAARKITGAVTGGTGAYAGARGVLVSTDSRTGSDTTITLET